MNDSPAIVPAVEVIDSPDTFAARLEELRRINATVARMVVLPFEEPVFAILDRAAKLVADFASMEHES